MDLVQQVIDNKERILETFKPELERISSDNMKKLTKFMLTWFADDFYETPSSSSGMYHPPDEHNGMGFILHNKRVAWWCVEFVKEHALSSKARDILIVSSLFHDLGRVDYIKRQKQRHNISKSHGKIGWAMMVEAIKLSNIDIKGLPIKEIKDAIEKHMTHWDSRWGGEMPTTKISFLFATADYCASRSEIKTPILDGLDD